MKSIPGNTKETQQHNLLSPLILDFSAQYNCGLTTVWSKHLKNWLQSKRLKLLSHFTTVITVWFCGRCTCYPVQIAPQSTLSYSFLHSVDNLTATSPRRVHAFPHCHMVSVRTPAPQKNMQRGMKTSYYRSSGSFASEKESWKDSYSVSPFCKHLFITHQQIYIGVPRMFCA